jgi:hypothetical protein
VGFNGIPTPRGNLTWTNTPVAISYYQPYLISLQSKSIEIHNVHNQNQVQTLNFPSIYSLFVSSSSLPLPLSCFTVTYVVLDSATLEIMNDARGELVLVSTASSPASM